MKQERIGMVALDFTDLCPRAVDEAVRSRAALVLPAGSISAHGPHLPLATNLLISNLVAARAVGRLRARGVDAYRLPVFAYGPAEAARTFPGTLAVSREASASILAEIAGGLVSMGFRRIGVFAVSSDPSLRDAIEDAARRILETSGIRVALPSPFDDRYSERLPEEFVKRRSHGGRLETSILLATHPESVDERELPSLAPVEIAGFSGGETLDTLGATSGYAGDPARASAEDGDRYLGVLGECVAAAILELPGR